MSVADRVIRLVAKPVPLRTYFIRKFLSRFPLGSFETRLKVGAFQRPWYAWCSYYAALQAKALGYQAVTIIEFGVAGGNGLICLCDYRDQIEKEMGIRIIVQGFDTGTGLPKSSDSRDLLYCWRPGSFEMDYPKLTQRLNGRAKVVLGNVAETTTGISVAPEAPLGAIMFDLDFYTSTRDAFAVFKNSNLLPRVWCYFDDIDGYAENSYSDSIGVRAAIQEFNQRHEPLEQHLSRAYVFKGSVPEDWQQRIWVYHNMRHPQYNECLSEGTARLDLAETAAGRKVGNPLEGRSRKASA